VAGVSESRDALPRAVGLGLAWAGYLVVALVFALLPARIALASHQAQFAGRAWELVVVGMAADSPFVVATYALVNVVGAAIAWGIARRLPSPRALRIAAVVATAAGFLFVLWGTISASEFKVERGLYPTSFDLSMGLADRAYVRSALGTFFLSRFLWGWVLALAGFVLLSWGFLRATDQPSPRRPVPEAALTAFVLGAVALLGFGLHRASPHLSSNFANWRVVESPFPVFFRSLGTSHENIRFGYIALVEHIGSPEADRAPGAAMLGLPPDAGRRVADVADCSPHPLAEPFSVPTRDAGAGSNHEFASRVGSVVDELSRELFADRKRVRVWHVGLESMRADDIAALNPKVPAGLTPTLDGLHTAAAMPEPRVIAARRMHQAGVRTSQGLAALVCGTGTMPWGLSSARDLGLPPLRCLPDVLKDAGFSLHFYYGSNPAFDNMQSFLHYHGFDHLMTERDYVEDTPHRGWAVPDRIVLSQALAASDARPQGESQYNLLMTLSHHHPFDRPEDLPAEVGERVRKIAAASGQSVGADHLKRLDTLSYSDFALGEMIAKLEASAAAADSLLVIGGDHATADYFLWRGGATLSGAERQHALSHIPFLVVFPEELVKSCANPARVHSLISDLNTLLGDRPTSQNDVPRLILGLLARGAALSTLPETERWHTLGGQTLSPHFRVASAPDTVVIGVDAASRLFRITEAGAMVDPDEPAKPVFDVESARGVTPTLMPEAALLSSFMTGYARRCWPWSSIRRVK
jgi:hypothetical protein